jgi:hypothetical protein
MRVAPWGLLVAYTACAQTPATTFKFDLGMLSPDTPYTQERGYGYERT